MIAFNSAVECRICSNHTPSTSSALRNHVMRIHAAASAANLGLGHRFYKAPTPAMPYCDVCQLYVDDQAMYSSHQSTEYHHHFAHSAASSVPSGSKPSQRPQATIPDVRLDDITDEALNHETEREARKEDRRNEPSSSPSRSDDLGASAAGAGSTAASSSSGFAARHRDVAADWLGRGDRIDFGAIVGEVYLAPFNTPLWNTDLLAASTDHANYARYRAVQLFEQRALDGDSPNLASPFKPSLCLLRRSV